MTGGGVLHMPGGSVISLHFQDFVAEVHSGFLKCICIIIYIFLISKSVTDAETFHYLKVSLIIYYFYFIFSIHSYHQWDK